MSCKCQKVDCAGCDPDTLPDCAPSEQTVETPYHCSLVAGLQSVMDMGRMLNHEFGLRPYRCFLVWQRRDHNQRFKEIKRIELLPVRVALTSQFTRIQWMLSSGGSRPEGDIQLFEISPDQVDEATLRGQLDGQDPPDGVEFFYEIVRAPRCLGDKIIPWRFALASLPFLEADRFQWVVDLTDQATPRADASLPDRDQVHPRLGSGRTGSAVRI